MRENGGGGNVLTYFSSLCCDTGEPVVTKVGMVNSSVAGAWMEDGWREITDPVQPPAFVLTWCKLRGILYAEEIGGSLVSGGQADMITLPKTDNRWSSSLGLPL